MKMRKKLGLALAALVLVSGCASNKAAQDYYSAMQAAASAKAQTDTARYEALSKMAAAGGEASVAATMAIALTQPSTITPQYVESSALKWAQILTPTIGTLGLGIVQAGVAKNASNNASQVQMASMASNQAIQLGQQDMVTNLGGQWASGAAASGQQLVDLGVAGFGALNTAGDQTVALGTAGLNSATTIATAGFTSNENIATTGFGTVESVSIAGMTGIVDTATIGMDNLNNMGQFGMTTVGAVGIAGMDNLNDMGQFGMTTVGAVGLAGMNNLNDMGQFGMTTVGAVGLAGMNNLTTLGTTGMENLTTLGTTGMENMLNLSLDYNDLIDSMDTTSANTLTTTLADANDTNLQGQTNFAQIIADMQATIDAMSAQLNDPITCADDGTGTIVCD